MRPVTHYARSGDVHIAYQTAGVGPPDVLVVDQWFSNVDAQWEFPPLARLLERVFWLSWVGLGIVTFVALRLIWDGSAQIAHQGGALALPWFG